MEEYQIASEGRVYLFTGSRITGGFCVTRKGLLLPSKLGHILTDMPALMDYTAGEGAFLPYKGRWYGWTAISPDGMLTLSEPAMQFLKSLAPGMELLSIRSSDIAFTMGSKGPLLGTGRRTIRARFPYSDKSTFHFTFLYRKNPRRSC